ncbi:MAG: diaminopimelate decarboxylase [Gammaproteobacteria bacterium]|nr:diaminopimelate decarboxylase [Gammaproteobacteria bacterium]
MTCFTYRNGQLYAEDVALQDITRAHGTPCYVYSRAGLEANWRAFDQAFAGHDHLVCFAVKANSNLAVLNLLARLGSGFDVVSGGELERVLAAGGDARKVVFSGVGKREDEMQRAIEAGILCFNVESEAELQRLNRVAGKMRRRAPVALRVNPDVDARTHPYISTGLSSSKFGIPIADAPRLYAEAKIMAHVEIVGVDCHIGSQITEVEPFVDALSRVLDLVDELSKQGIVLRHIDTGGGVGIAYRGEQPPTPERYAAALLDLVQRRLHGRALTLLIEPGRAIAGDAGLLLTRVEYLKQIGAKHFAVVDAAMNDLMRPALYDAYHAIQPVRQQSGATEVYEVVGPVCETSDFLGHERALRIAEGDLLAIMDAGAYGMSMSSNYNTRARAAEVIVDGAKMHLAREREQISALFASERSLP